LRSTGISAKIAAEAVRRIDEIFEIERAINSRTPEEDALLPWNWKASQMAVAPAA